MRVRVKICGITEPGAAAAAVEAGADALGFVFASGRRRVSLEKAYLICTSLPAMVSRIGVFVNAAEREIREVVEVCGLDGIQLHGEEAPELLRKLAPLPIIKAIPVKNRRSLEQARLYPNCTLLLDTYHPRRRGGGGKAFDWSVLEGASFEQRVILAGGLNPGNVHEVLRRVRPWGVDVSSGVESGGIKDPQKIKEFVAQVRRWENDAAR